MYREGVVSEVDAPKHRVRCTMNDREGIASPWLRVLVTTTRDDLSFGLPTVGQTVAILLDEAESTAVARGVKFRDGTIVEVDAEAHVVRVVLPSGGVLELAGNADFIALAQLVLDNLTAIESDLTAIQTTLGTGTTPIGGPVTFGSPYVKAYVPSAVAAAQVKSA